MTEPQQPSAQDPYQSPSSGYGQADSGYGQGGYAQQGYPGQGTQPYGQYAGPAGEHPQGTTVFVLGIVGIFVGICAPIAWYLGNKALRETAASGASYTNDSQLRTGRMLGKVFTILYIVFIVLYVILLVAIFGIAAANS